MATSWTSDDIAALESAIKKGVRRVSYQSGSVEYHTLAEMLQLLDTMNRAVNGSGDVTRVVGGYDSGLFHARPGVWR